jgi:hypothetical protein
MTTYLYSTPVQVYPGDNILDSMYVYEYVSPDRYWYISAYDETSGAGHAETFSTSSDMEAASPAVLEVWGLVNCGDLPEYEQSGYGFTGFTSINLDVYNGSWTSYQPVQYSPTSELPTGLNPNCDFAIGNDPAGGPYTSTTLFY